MSIHAKFQAMKKDLGITNRDVSEITGNTYDSVKSTTQPNKSFPRNLKLAIWVWERLTKEE